MESQSWQAEHVQCSLQQVAAKNATINSCMNSSVRMERASERAAFIIKE